MEYWLPGITLIWARRLSQAASLASKVEGKFLEFSNKI